MPNPEPGERWGILGGTFDPIHEGHITLARDIKLRRKLTGVLFVPSFHHPFKTNHAEASYTDRLEMVRLAIASEPDFIAIDIEREQTLSGYTIDTIRALKERYQQVAFEFIIGADNIDQLKEWHNPEEIFEQVTVVAGTRPGFKPERCDGLASKIEYIETSAVDASSTDIRQALRRGEDLEQLPNLINPRVFSYIKQGNLYQ